jgi:hypothetical protein
MAETSVTVDIIPIAIEDPITSGQGISSPIGLFGGASIVNSSFVTSLLKRGER